jgi:membrane protein
MTEPRDDEDSADAVGVQTTADARDAPRRHPVRRLLGRTIDSAWDDDIFSESASAAFWQTLSLPPLLLGLFGVLGYVGGWFGPDTVTAVQQWISDLTTGVFSRNAVNEIIVPTVADVLTTARGEVVSIGFVLSFWSGSSAMAAFVDATTRAHGQYQLRNLVWQRILAILLYLVGLAVGIVFLPIVALSPDRLLPLLPDAWEPAAALVLG